MQKRRRTALKGSSQEHARHARYDSEGVLSLVKAAEGSLAVDTCHFAFEEYARAAKLFGEAVKNTRDGDHTKISRRRLGTASLALGKFETAFLKKCVKRS